MESNPPPSLPEVYDEAGKSPRWLPVLGLGLLVLLAAAIVFMTRHASPPTAAPDGQAVQVNATSAPTPHG
jgi:hypothetical protein